MKKILALAVALVALPTASDAVRGGLGTLALLWAQGEYRAPMICEIEGRPIQALRRIRVRTTPRSTTQVMGVVTFFDVDAPPDTSCYSEEGQTQPNLIGKLTLVFEGRDRPDTAEHDFEEELRRKGGFRYRIASGRLRVGTPGAPERQLEAIDFKDGNLRLEAVRRGSDAFRRLAEFGPRDKRVLILTAPDGRGWTFDLVDWAAMGPR